MDRRTDIYAMGLVLCRCLAARDLREDPGAVMAQVRGGGGNPGAGLLGGLLAVNCEFRKVWRTDSGKSGTPEAGRTSGMI